MTGDIMLTGGGRLYVAPLAFAASGGDVLFLGVPNYVWDYDSAGNPRTLETNTILGVLMRADGRVERVPSPIEARRVGGVAATGRADGTWDVILIEQPPWTNRAPPDTVLAVWAGVYDGRSWTRVERLPVPPGASMRHHGFSSVAVVGDTVAWAGILRTGWRRDIALFTRTRGGWSVDVLPTAFTQYVEVAPDPAGGVMLAAVHPENGSTRGQDGLFIWRFRERWLAEIVVPIKDEPVFDPQFGSPGTLPVLTWWSETRRGGNVRNPARALVDPLGARAPVFDFAADLAQFGSAAHLNSSPRSLWLTTRASEAGEFVDIIEVTREGPRTVRSIPGHYEFWVNGVARTSTEVLFAGPVYITSDPFTTTRLTRVRLCEG